MTVSSLARSKDNRGISFCDTISSSKSSCKGSNGSIVEIDDGQSSLSGSCSHEEDDVHSRTDEDDGDLDEKIRWFFLNIENQDSTEGSEQSAPHVFSDEENLPNKNI